MRIVNDNTQVFYSRENKTTLEQVKEALNNGLPVEWHNAYETFYGHSWFGWVKESLKGTPCKITVLDYDRIESFVSKIKIDMLADVEIREDIIKFAESDGDNSNDNFMKAYTYLNGNLCQCYSDQFEYIVSNPEELPHDSVVELYRYIFG